MDEETEFKEGDELAIAGDKAALMYGWWADRWICAEAQRSGEHPNERGDPSSRAAFSYAISTLEKRHRKSLSRSQVADRIRVGRAFPKQKYDDICEELDYTYTFSQLRAAFVRDDEKRTMELLAWARDHDADPISINAMKMGGDVESDDAKAWRHLVEWAYKYRERCCAKTWNNDKKEKDRLAREIVDYDQKCRLEPKTGL